MSKNLIYANADEFHVKSTIVYAKASKGNKLVLYWDSECTKPIYSDELKRLYLAGGLKIYYSIPDTEFTAFLSPAAFFEYEVENAVMCVTSADAVLHFYASARPASSDDINVVNMVPDNTPAEETPSH